MDSHGGPWEPAKQPLCQHFLRISCAATKQVHAVDRNQYLSCATRVWLRAIIGTSHREMALSDYINTFGQYTRRRLGERAHKLALNAAFTCPNRDGSRGYGGCSFCNNASFSPGDRRPPDVAEQIDAGRRVIRKRTGAKQYIAYFQAYTNTYADLETLRNCYDTALAEEDVIGLSIGTRPDCLPESVVALLAEYQAQGYDIWLELGLQSSFDETLQRVNRGHGFAEYVEAIELAHRYGLRVCTHLMLGLPGEDHGHALITLHRVLKYGVEGLKIHPLHVVKNTLLAAEWRRGDYHTMTRDEYIEQTCDLIERTPKDIVFHRLTGTASADLLLDPSWCEKKWTVLNGIEFELKRRRTRQASRLQEH